MSVYFARPRTDYDPYRDVYKIIELSGFELRYINDISWWNADDTVIFTPANGELEGVPTDRRIRFIHWDFERSKPGQARNSAFDETWVSDRALAQAIGARYVMFGGHRAFGSLDVLDKRWDTVTLMAWFGRRTDLRYWLDEASISIADPGYVGGNWGQNRVETLQRSRIMVSCHQDELPWSEPIRLAIAGMYGLPIISETCADAGLWNGRYLQADMRDIPCTVKSLLQDPVRQARMGAAAWRLVCAEHPFRQCVEQALERVIA